MNVFQLIYSDYKKYKKYGSNFLSILFLTQGFWASMQYRIANFIFRNVNLPVLRQLLLVLCLIWQKLIELSTGISIPASVQIGHSLYIGHFGNIIINANSSIGNNCNISQGVTIGVSGRNSKRGVPIIGDNVYLGVNAVIIGKIKVEDNVLIAANSLIIKDVEMNSVMMGVPAVKISDNGSIGYV
ncbi:MAG: serine acetyltransferase [Bacteroidetes bacterium]|nr:serine acetyltransferase [Bacteroidota bacterium]